MGMDGLYRPSQALGYTDTLGQLNAVERLKAQQKKASAVNSHNAVEKVGDENQDQDQPGKGKKRQPDKPEMSAFEEDLQRAIALQFGLTLDPTVLYQLQYNDLSDQFELKNMWTGEIILRLNKTQFLQLTDSIKRNEGLITDQSA